jgi:hypothetical protein
VPDDFDYADLGALLARPSTWTEAESEYVRGLRESQAEVLEAAHPKDRQSRERLQLVLAEVDGAIEAWRASKS